MGTHRCEDAFSNKRDAQMPTQDSDTKQIAILPQKQLEWYKVVLAQT
jgi:hypothetical protein